VHWFNIFLLGFTLSWSWIYATRTGLIREETPTGVRKAILRRVIGAQALRRQNTNLGVDCFWLSGDI
jgi:hypothetical protein